MGRELLRRLAEVSWDAVHFHWPYLIAAGLSALAAGALLPAAYRTMLAPFCRPPGWARMLPAVWISGIGKYLPGKVASLAGVVWFLSRERVPVPIATGVMFMVAGLLLLLAVGLSVPLTLFPPVSDLFPLAWLWCLVLLAGGLVCIHPAVFGPAVNLVLRKCGRAPLESLPALRDYVAPLLILAAQWLLSGLGLWFVASSLSTVSFAEVPLFVAANALATSAGLLALFAPAGLGVREGVLLIFLSPLVGPHEAAIVVVIVRLVQTAADVLLAAAGLLVMRALRAGTS